MSSSEVESIQYLLYLSQSRVNRVFEEELSTRSQSGIEYAAAVLYAEHLGIYLVGRVPPWVRRLRKYPLAVPDQLLWGVRAILSIQNVELTDDGILRARQGIPVRKL